MARANFSGIDSHSRIPDSPMMTFQNDIWIIRPSSPDQCTTVLPTPADNNWKNDQPRAHWLFKGKRGHWKREPKHAHQISNIYFEIESTPILLFVVSSRPVPLNANWLTPFFFCLNSSLLDNHKAFNALLTIHSVRMTGEK